MKNGSSYWYLKAIISKYVFYLFYLFVIPHMTQKFVALLYIAASAIKMQLSKDERDS